MQVIINWNDFLEALRSTDEIGLQKGGSHLTAKCATGLVLAGSTIRLCSTQWELFSSDASILISLENILRIL